jgi:hypothetical protein
MTDIAMKLCKDCKWIRPWRSDDHHHHHHDCDWEVLMFRWPWLRRREEERRRQEEEKHRRAEEQRRRWQQEDHAEDQNQTSILSPGHILNLGVAPCQAASGRLHPALRTAPQPGDTR